jgi:DNA-binding response OmpR family regulator
MRTIIVVEDNKQINQMITENLSRKEYKVFSFYNAIEALTAFQNHDVDCVITDLKLPVMSGEELISRIRNTSNVHIIVITAKTTITDKLEVLQLGADDYLYKPFVPQEIILKLDNLFAKMNTRKETTYQFGDVKFKKGQNQLEINGTMIELTSLEYKMIAYMVDRPKTIITRDDFIHQLYAHDEDVFDRVIDTHIKNIRQKIKEHTNQPFIKTIYGLGYTFVGDDDA